MLLIILISLSYLINISAMDSASIQQDQPCVLTLEHDQNIYQLNKDNQFKLLQIKHEFIQKSQMPKPKLSLIKVTRNISLIIAFLWMAAKYTF